MIGDRVKQARKLAGMSQQQLGEEIGVKKMTICKYESNTITPSSTSLIKLSHALNVNIEYFFRETTLRLTAEPQFRMAKKTDKLTKKEEEKILTQTALTLEKQLEIMDIMNIENCTEENKKLQRTLTDYHTDIETLAETIRKKWNLGQDPIENLMSTAEDNGFKIILSDGPDNFEALTLNEQEIGPIIALKTGAAKERQRFTLAHEIGHYFILPSWYDSEGAANTFAAAFLMPKNTLIHDVGPRRTTIRPDELLILREKYGVSIPSILARMETLKIISKTTKKTLLDTDKEQRWSTRTYTEVYLQTEKPRMFCLLVQRALAEGIISAGKYREFLEEKIAFSSIAGDA